MSYTVAIVGATGNVGREILTILAEREFPISTLYALASQRSRGVEISYGDRDIRVTELEGFDFSDVDIALFSAGSEVSKVYAVKAAEAGALVIDNASLFRMDADVPLIVPEVNAHVLKRGIKRNIIANPNCSAAQLMVALKPLHDAATLKRVVVSTYQSVSGAGRAAMDELWHQTRAIFVNSNVESKSFTRQIAFNVIPHIDQFRPDGATGEEWKIAVESQKILDFDVPIIATCVRVPVFVCHAEAVFVAFERPLSAADARDILTEAPGCLVVDDPQQERYVTPIECVGDYATYISRIREDPTVPHGLALWVVSDNLRKGAALNAVQIAETMIEQGLKPRS